MNHDGEFDKLYQFYIIQRYGIKVSALKEMIKLFDENIDEIQKYIQKGNYYACANISFDLLLVSLLADFKEGIFVWNLVKNTFLQIDLLLEQYEIDEEERNVIKNNCNNNIKKLQKFYYQDNDDGDEDIFNILVEFTVISTKTEFKYQKVNKNIAEKTPFYQ